MPLRRAILIGIVLPCTYLAFLGAGIVSGAHATINETGHVCFSKQKWSADDGDRPCLHVILYEDGTFRSTVEQADGDAWTVR